MIAVIPTTDSYLPHLSSQHQLKNYIKIVLTHFKNSQTRLFHI